MDLYHSTVVDIAMLDLYHRSLLSAIMDLYHSTVVDIAMLDLYHRSDCKAPH
jgi:hypothetical protein